MAPPEPARPCVLVADDDPLIRMVLRAALEGDGYEVREAQTGEAAVMAVATADLALAILDVHMPGPGFERTLRDLRSRRIPVLVLSGDAAVTAGQSTEQLAYLGKPVSVDDLLASVTSLISASKALPGE